MRKELIPYYSANSKARMFLFEKFVNLNTIANSSRLLYFNYIQNSSSEKEIFMGKTLLYTSNAYCFDFNWVNQFSNDFPFSCPDFSNSPIIAGLWFSCRIFVMFVKKEQSNSTIYNDIDKYLKSKEKSWSDFDRQNFEIALFFGLVNTKQYQQIFNRLSSLLKQKEPGTLSPQEKALTICHQLANWQLSRSVSDNDITLATQLLNDPPAWANYQTTIIGKTWLAICYLNQGEVNKAYENYKKAIQISNMCGYTLFEVKLLLALSKVLKSVGETDKAQECVNLSQNLAHSNNIDFDLL